MSEEKVNGVLHCIAFGDLLPSDICENCDGCKWNHEFADRGGYPAMLLSGNRENLAVALRQPGVPMEDVVVVNAKLFQKMENALKKIAEFQPAEYYECGGECNTCNQMIDMAKEELGFLGKTEFTPGPWQAEEDGLIDKMVVGGNYDLIIDITHKDGKRNEADSTLISIAPDMIQLIYDSFVYWNRQKEVKTDFVPIMQRHYDLLKKMNMLPEVSDDN